MNEIQAIRSAKTIRPSNINPNENGELESRLKELGGVPDDLISVRLLNDGRGEIQIEGKIFLLLDKSQRTIKVPR